MARHHNTTASHHDATDTQHLSSDLLRSALGPGYAVGPSGRLLDYVARASGLASDGA